MGLSSATEVPSVPAFDMSKSLASTVAVSDFETEATG